MIKAKVLPRVTNNVLLKTPKLSVDFVSVAMIISIVLIYHPLVMRPKIFSIVTLNTDDDYTMSYIYFLIEYSIVYRTRVLYD